MLEVVIAVMATAAIVGVSARHSAETHRAEPEFVKKCRAYAKMNTIEKFKNEPALTAMMFAALIAITLMFILPIIL